MISDHTGLQPTRVSRSSFLVGAAVRLACVFSLVGLGVMGALTLGVVLLSALGYHATVISGGSMEPAINNGSLVISRPVPADSLGIGDIITFKRPEAQTSVTHRIVAEHDVDAQPAFTTKGDNNAMPDPADISFSTDTQRLVFSLPYAGYATAFMHSPRIMLLLIALPAIGLAALFVLGIGCRGEDEDLSET